MSVTMDPFARKPILLGTKVPTPALIQERKPGDPDMLYSLGVIPKEGRPIYTPLNATEAQGRANRNIPVPSFMAIADKIHAMATPENKTRAMLVLGDPSAGKTFNLTGVANHYGPPAFYACDGKRADELFKQVRFSYSDGESLTDKVDRVLSEINNGVRRMDPLSEQALKQLGDAFTFTEERYAIDWTKASNAVSGEDAKEKSEDRIFPAIKNFMQAQGLSIEQKQMAIKYVDGPIITAIKQKKPFLILDEFTRLEDYGGLLSVMEVFMGLKDFVELKDADGNPVPCVKGELPILLMTGNTLSDSGVTKMPDALRSRLKTITVEAPDTKEARVQNWQHVIETLLAGVPFNTYIEAVYGGDKKFALQDADLLRNYFPDFYLHGMTPSEAAGVSEFKSLMQLNWEDVNEASQHLAEFFVDLPALFDPKAPQYNMQNDRAANAVNGNEPNPADVIKSALRRMDPKPCIDFRAMAQCIADAMQPTPGAVKGSAGDFRAKLRNTKNLAGSLTDSTVASTSGSTAFQPPTQDPAEMARNFGPQLVDAIIKWRDETLKLVAEEARPHLKEKIDALMANHRLINQPGEQKNIKHKRVDELLTIDPNKHKHISQEAKVLRAEMVRQIEEKFPGLQDIEKNFMSDTEVARILKAVNAQDTQKELIVVNPNMTEHTLDKPFTAAFPNMYNKPMPTMNPQFLVSAESVLESIALPAIGKKNFGRLWKNGDLGRALSIKEGDPLYPALQVAEGNSPHGIAITTITCKNKQGKLCPIQIVHNRITKKTLIVGEEIDPKLKSRLQSKDTGLGINYIDRNDTNLASIVKKHINEIITSEEARTDFLNAFALRNQLSFDDKTPLTINQLGAVGTTRLLLNNGTTEYIDRFNRSFNVKVENTVPTMMVARDLSI